MHERSLETRDGHTVFGQNSWVAQFLQRAQCSHCKRNARIASAVIATAIPSVRLSVTRRYCVKTTARTTVQFAPLDSKMYLVLWKPKNIAQGRPLPPEILAPSDLPTPEDSEFCHILPCSASTVRDRKEVQLRLTSTRPGLSNEPSTKVLRRP